MASREIAGSHGKELPAKAEESKDAGSIPGWSRSPGVGNGTPVFLPGKFHGQRSLAGYIVHAVAKNWV